MSEILRQVSVENMKIWRYTTSPICIYGKPIVDKTARVPTQLLRIVKKNYSVVSSTTLRTYCFYNDVFRVVSINALLSTN